MSEFLKNLEKTYGKEGLKSAAEWAAQMAKDAMKAAWDMYDVATNNTEYDKQKRAQEAAEKAAKQPQAAQKPQRWTTWWDQAYQAKEMWI